MREALQREAACCRYEVSTARGSGRVSDSLTVSSRGTPLLSNGIQSHDPPVTAGGLTSFGAVRARAPAIPVTTDLTSFD